ncbi:hypothetical protein HRbin10_01190 [bacterium HR10]|uniref:Uncharacterized protein n=1 Tax=uncultured Acidobacteriota bacterium TaxID=171953 RepID=H5SQ29_9BACT|nr:hypothetical protein HGMM_F55E10C27 [uncultured Acidobacteriota bacterium]GBC82070.1 hypothetical protein HRbin10_01190 [bacterium HR10]
MRRIVLVIFVSGLLGSVSLAAPPQGCSVELISLHRLSLPVPGSAGLKDLALAVDERGILYVSFASWPTEGAGPRAMALPYIVSYDPSGKLLRVFERPSIIPETARWARITSLAYTSGRVYAAAQWQEGSWRSALLIFGTSGDLQRTVVLEGLRNPWIVPLGSQIGVLGTVWTEKGQDVGVLQTFSADGERVSEHMAEPFEPKAHLLSDGTGRVLAVEPSGKVEVFHPRKTWASLPGGFGHIHAAFTGDGAIIINRVDLETRRTSLLFLNDRGGRCEADTTGRLAPMVRGADGFFYGIGQLGFRPDTPTDRREILVGKFRIVRQ